MGRISIMPSPEPAPRVRVRLVNVKVRARRCTAAAVALGIIAGVLAFLFDLDTAKAGWWVAVFVLPPLACGLLGVYFYRTEEPQQRRVFDGA